ncbi:MAG: pentapeptide repeat-containing protein [Oligoflexales bacterium]
MQRVEGAQKIGTQVVIDEENLKSIILVLSEEAPELTEEQLREVALKAVDEGQLHNRDWLTEEIAKQRRSLIPEPPSSIPVNEVCEIKTIEELQAVIARHKAWMEAVLSGKGPSEGRAVFRHTNLDGYDFKGSNLSCADFRYASVIGANFEGCNLSRAKFDGACLRSANFSHTQLKGASFQGTDLRGVSFVDVDHLGCDLSAAIT